ncbi:hypothetical protein NKR19_g6824 [Coniochaeta hoffmannii]|uniref:Uncharacterized protein n=1 Tax=Coniochaeta hoffmannii TaxID=91930 RepID=A0AA38VP65_9PEZI|nr:hypothetical protein NKR19_g6824 [Coniochaeta hoffmannii]
MARGTLPSAGFQLALPDSEQFSSPTNEAQGNQQSSASPDTVHGNQQSNGGNGQQHIARQHANAQQHDKGQQQNAQGDQGRDPNGNQFHRVISAELKQLMQATAPAQNMITQAKPGLQPQRARRGPDNGTNGQTSHAIGSDSSPNVQAFNGQTMMASVTPVPQQQQPIMPTSNHNSPQVPHGYSRNYQQPVQPVQAFDRQNMMVQGSSGYQQNPVMLGQASMSNQQLHCFPGAMYAQPGHGNNIMPSGPLDGQQYEQGSFPSNAFDEFIQGDATSAMFNLQQPGVMMPDNPFNFQPAMGHMANNNNNMTTQQHYMGFVSGSDQFQHSSELQNLFQDMQGQDLLHRLDQNPEHQSGTPSTPTRVRAEAGNQNVVDSMEA